MTKISDTSTLTDNLVSAFQVEAEDTGGSTPQSPSVRGRAVRLGDTIDLALRGTAGIDRYPPTVAALLGEAMMIGALVARALKFKGRLVVQCHGTNDGAVSLLVADCTTDGAVRGYARWDKDKLREILLDSRNPGASELIGKGTFSMTIDQGPDMDNYQGLAAIDGDRLSDCAEHYFSQSEQIETKIRLACGRISAPGQDEHWRAGGMMIQKIAGDKSRGDTDEAWNSARSFFGTLTDAELLDPELPQERLLYRLFNETGVRLLDQQSITADCACSEERLRRTLESFDDAALSDIAEDGKITANCEFCGTDYIFDVAGLRGA